MKNLKTYFITAIGLTVIFSCTKLEEKPLDGVAPEGGSTVATSELKTVLNNVAGIYNEWNRSLGIQEMPADGMAGPTRGGDWDDNAALRQIHAHTWAPDHPWIKDTYNTLLTGIYNADLILNNSAQSDIHPQIKFLKSFFYYHMLDKFGQVPYRADYEDLTKDALVYSRSEAFDIAVQLAEESLSGLPVKTTGDPSILNKDAANMLLAKLYLNKAVFKSEPGIVSYEFDSADMTKVISYINELSSELNDTNSNGSSYWENFSPENDQSNEVIFSLKVVPGGGGADEIGSTNYYWRMGQHYNQTPGGWNGPVIVGEYYDYFLEHGVSEGDDPRVTWSTPDIIEMMGNPVGIQRGQIYKPGGTEKVLDRKGNDLIFTKEVPLVVLDPVAIESAGFRSIKYIPDDFDNPGADNVIFRHADAMLMRAEAALRGGTGADAQSDLDEVRARVGLGSINANLDNIYTERARELWLEGWRRTDMIRFGTFLDAKELKPAESDPKFLLFPIPADGLLNPNISQNSGY